MTYRAPVRDILFAMTHIADLKSVLEGQAFEELDEDLVGAILEEAGKFANERIAPLNRLGDEQGARLVDGRVEMPEGWAETYHDWVEAGWGSLPCPKDYGGQGLPILLAMACAEIWNSASMAFALNPVLTQAAVHALSLYGTDEQKRTYLEKLVSGVWTGTMQLTEPQAGSDLGQLKTKAVCQADGTYRLTGTKIFITYGEHPLAENIVHMVLARTPDAPPGTKGISLFLVPKFLVNDDGSTAERNDVACTKLEHKLGIHGSPTCVMTLGDQDGAVGWLVGEENKGLVAMFAMMNEARLGVGVQGVGIAERAFQQALAYAQERTQGRTAGTPPEEMVPIISHPDVRRMLLSMRAKVSAARAICYVTAQAIDLARHGPSDDMKAAAHAKASLLTPVAKAYSTDVGVEVSSEAIQVHGGMGYIEEAGAAQHYRDARITPIYEGTNGIQAIDLVTRKLPMNGGDVIGNFLQDLGQIVGDVQSSNHPGFGLMGERLEAANIALAQATEWLLKRLTENTEAALSAATPYCQLFGIAAGGTLLAKGAMAVSKDPGRYDNSQISIARYFAEQISTEAPGLAQSVRAPEVIMEFPGDKFTA